MTSETGSTNVDSHGIHRLFLIPELLLAVVERLGNDNRSLRAACLVNTAWARHGLGLIWRSTKEEHLLRVATTTSRRQFYAAMVQHLSLDRCLAFLARLNFPRLRHVDCGCADSGYIYGESRRARDYHANVQAWLPPGVTSLSIPQCGEWLLPPQAFVYYATLGSLEALCLIDKGGGGAVSIAMAQHLAAAARGPSCPPVFPRLHSLRMYIDAAALQQLAPVLRRSARLLTDVALHMSSMDASVLPSVALLETLTAARVALPRWSTLSNPHILALGQLRSLRRLTVAGLDIVAPDFGDSELTLLLARLTQLQRLTWFVDCALSPAALGIISVHCPLLQCLRISGMFSLRALDHAAEPVPQFPLLEILIVDHFQEVFLLSQSQPAGDQEREG